MSNSWVKYTDVLPLMHCEMCAHWGKDRCLKNKQGYPTVGDFCDDYEREPGVEG